MAKTFTLSNQNQPFTVVIGGFPMLEAETSDRRRARRYVRMARKCGFPKVKFTVKAAQ